MASFGRRSVFLLATLLIAAQLFTPTVTCALTSVNVEDTGEKSVDAKQVDESSTPTSKQPETDGCECNGCRRSSSSESRRSSPGGINDVLHWMMNPSVRHPRALFSDFDALLDAPFRSWPALGFLDTAGFDSSPSAPISSNVAVRTLSSDDDSTVLGVRLPGVPRENLKVSVDAEGLLTVEGGYSETTTRHSDDDKKDSAGEEETRHQFHFFAQRQLPFGVDASRVSADYKDGLLRVTVPKPQKDSVTRVSIV
jgi:HSP20 family molecular chaperone IbpA